MPGSMERASMSPPSTPEGAAPPAPSVPGSSGKLLRAKNKIMSALNRAKSAQRGTHARSFEAKFDDLQPAGFSSPDTELRSISPSTHTHRIASVGHPPELCFSCCIGGKHAPSVLRGLIFSCAHFRAGGVGRNQLSKLEMRNAEEREAAASELKNAKDDARR